MLWFTFIALFCINCIAGLRTIDIGNQNGFPIWIQTQPNDGKPPLRNGEIVLVNPGERTTYDIDDAGWGGRLWAKVGCDESGANCEFGQSVDPCPSGGCQPPAETKVEFFFPPMDSPDASYYDISLVDGFSLASEIVPYKDVSLHLQLNGVDLIIEISWIHSAFESDYESDDENKFDNLLKTRINIIDYKFWLYPFSGSTIGGRVLYSNWLSFTFEWLPSRWEQWFRRFNSGW